MLNFFSVHQCLFCTQSFKSSAAKDDHILEHFAHETCNDCHRDLIRIGKNLYVLHSSETCIREYDENYYDDVSSKLATVLVDEQDQVLQHDALELGKWMKSEPNYDDNENAENPLQVEEGDDEAETNDSTAEYSTMDEDSQQNETNTNTAESNMDEDSQQQQQQEEANTSTAESMNDESISREAMDFSKLNKINIKLEMDANANKSDKEKSAKKEENKRECELCGEFFHRYALYRHKRDVHNPTFCVCQLCYTQFKSAEYLNRYFYILIC